MGQALYRKYRSKNFSEIVGQEHITATLDRAIQTGRISHAYLLTGPRGVGKTSVARILAHAINNLDYTDDSSHIDIIEIDAASNRRIDEIRDLREKVFVAPTSAKYKVYIIDEVHMLTREAFNALLKTLEEPPAHVVFVLATTDAHKLPDTIVSRTQRFSFKPIEVAKVVEHLKTIAKQEKIKVDDDALELLAVHGEGSFRDSISLLDQASSNGERVTKASVQALLGVPPEEQITELVASLEAQTGDLALIAGKLAALYDQGFQAGAIAKQLGKLLRAHLLASEADKSSVLFELMGSLLEVPGAHNPELFLEILLLRAAGPVTETAPSPKAPVAEATPTPPTQPKPAPVAETEAAPQKPATKSKPETADTSEVDTPKQASTAAPSNAVLDDVIWQQVLTALKQKHNTLYGVVRMAEPSYSKGTVRLACAFAFHQKRLSEARNQQKLADIIKEVSGKSVRIECVVDDSLKGKAAPAAKMPVAKPNEPLSAISNIFGGGELLE